MKTIHNYSIDVDRREQVIEMPKGAEPFNVLQGPGLGVVLLYALVNPKAPMVKRTFRVIGTNHYIEDDEKLVYINTWKADDGGSPLVFHIFEKLA